MKTENAQKENALSTKLQLDPETSAGYQVRRCHRRFDRLLHARLARHGIKAGYWYYLRILWIEDGLSQKVISDRTNVAENTTGAMINAMAKDGLVTRRPDSVDRRKVRVFLTEKGKALEAELMHYAFEINRQATHGIDQSQLEICLSVLRQMSENIGRSLDQIVETSPP